MKLQMPTLKKFTPLFFLVPILLSTYLCFHAFAKFQELTYLEERFQLLSKKYASLENDKKPRSDNLKNADHFYIDKYLETAAFLEAEAKSLLAHSIQEEASAENAKRLNFLQKENRLLFAEENLQRAGTLHEVMERQQHPVEIDEVDLKKLLSLIEGVEIGHHKPKPSRPKLIIQKFELIKKAISKQNKVYILNLQLLKREHVAQPTEK